MNDPRFFNSENDRFITISISKSTPPEEVLEAFMNELKSPLTSIRGWVEILSLETVKELHPRALQSISYIIDRIEREKEKITAYMNELKADSSRT